MKPGGLLQKTSAWLPTVLVLALVLAAGGRLIMLGLQKSASEARATAREALVRDRQAIESQLGRLLNAAANDANAAAHALNTNAAASLASILPKKNALWLNADGSVASAGTADPVLASSIASEWETADARAGVGPRAGFMGPMRQGSQWIVAARVPVQARVGDDGSIERAGWAVVFTDLDQLLSNAKLGRLIDAGYLFTLSQPDPVSRVSRVFLSSGPQTLADASTIAIRAPAVRTPGIAIEQPRGAYLELAVKPRDGWYPLSKLATNIGLLALVAWLIAFGTHDLVQKSRHLQAALAEQKRRTMAVSDRLMSEVEERQNLQKSYDHARYHDTFTGLPNRRYFMDQLDRALRDVRARKRQGVAVVLIDIDRFKLINETLGHTAGDDLMVQAARRFEKAAANIESVLARWGGDQFALLLYDVHSNEQALVVARAMQEQLGQPFEVRRHHLSVMARMGITCTDMSPQRAEDLLREADIALSVAKRPGSANAVAYVPAMGGDAASLVSLEADLHLALERNELRLLFQPIVDLRSRQVVGAEGLLRWQHPVEGLLRPDKFLSIAEEAGLMVPITRWAIHRACKLAGEWKTRLPPESNFYVSINLSATALRDPGLSEFVSSTLAKTHAAPKSLKFELTEGGLMRNVGVAREVLYRLHDMGVGLMLDDFGTGYSSLNHLQLFPFDYVKIDRPFVNRTAANSDTAESGIMSAMVQIASSMGLKAIAEIIETPAAAEALQKMGCDYGQGYFFGAPVEAEEALQRLRGREWSAPQAPAANESATSDDTLILPIISRTS
jgi:diguanylate cyclase (GGDEF)-like protein